MFKLPNEGESDLFNKLGFTQAQLKLYLTLLKMEKADAKTLSKHTSMPRSAVYRTLGELHKKGLVEKEIAKPHTFRATPIHSGLQLLIMQRNEEWKEIQEKAKTFLRKIQNKEKETLGIQDYLIVIIEGKERIIQRMRTQHDSAQRNADIITTFRRWMQILHYCYEKFVKALNRGVKYRIIIEKPNAGEGLPKNVLDLMTKPNLELALSSKRVKTNGAIFDGNEVTFNFYPSKLLSSSPIILTDHPSFRAMFQTYFNHIWLSTPKLDI